MRLWFVWFLFFPFLNHAQSVDSMPFRPGKSYVLSYFDDARGITNSPLRWNRMQWLICSSAVTATGLSAIADRPVQDWVQSNRTKVSNTLSENVFRHFGDLKYSFPLIGTMYLSGEIMNDNKLRYVALQSLKAFTFSAAVSRIPKQLFHRHRPDQTIPSDPFRFDGPFVWNEHTSFASAHTMNAFALASLTASAYRDKPWVGIIGYSLASFTGLSRIHDNRHWTSDVLAGAALGYGVGQLVSKRGNWLKRYHRFQKKLPVKNRQLN
jgi:membrane-associated phospholipid phosphatase